MITAPAINFNPFAALGAFRRPPCPECEDTIGRTGRLIAEPLGDLRVRLECDLCDWSQIYERDHIGGDARPVDLSPTGASWSRQPGAAPPRPRYKVPGCRCLAAEARLCASHFSAWCRAGRPEDSDAWAEAMAQESASPPKVVHDETPQNTGNDEPVDESEQRPTKPVHSPTTNEEPTMPTTPPPPTFSKSIKTCCVDGCDEPSKSWELCPKHGWRYMSVGKPEGEAFERWLAAGAPTKAKWSESRESPPAKTSKNKTPKRSRETKPARETRATHTAPADPQLVELPQGTQRLRVLVVGDYLTIATEDGLMLRQIPMLEVTQP